MLRAYEQAARAASDYTSDINAALRKGKKSSAIETAKKLKAMGLLTYEQISSATDLLSSKITRL
jgi:hypothetical protein